MKKSVLFFTVIVVFSELSFAQKTDLPKIVNTFHIQSAGGWDYITANPSSNKLYVSHGTQVNILDKKTGDSIGVIENTTGVHGIAFINKLGKGYTSNGKLNNVTVFDLATQKVINQIPTGENPDAIFYEPFSKTIITCNGRSKNLTVIDPITEKVIATIEVGGKPETAVSNEAGMVYVNVEDKNEIVAIDITKHQVMAHWPINAEGPTGLAIDSKTKRLFAGANEKLVVVNAKDGNVVTTLSIGARCDGVAYDNSTKNIYTSNGSGTMTVIHALNADSYKIIGNLVTKKGARTIGIDESTHTLYLPTANFEPQEANDKSRPKMIPGTFQILVIK